MEDVYCEEESPNEGLFFMKNDSCVLTIVNCFVIDFCDDSAEEVWDEQETNFVSDDYVTSIAEALPSDEYTAEDDRKASYLCVWLIYYLTNLQAVFHLPYNTMQSILNFFSAFFIVLSKISPVCSTIVNKFPRSLHLLHTSVTVQSFIKYVVCKKCHMIYTLNDCIEGSGAYQHGRMCMYQEFPNHPHSRLRAKCNYPLLKSIELSTGRKVLYPYLTYCYFGIENSIISLFRQSQNYELLVNSTEKYRPSSVLTDVCNGNVWSEFQTFNDKPFLSDPLCLALCMNVDWFQPYKHVTYSVGIIYLAIMNLPREERYKRENVLLIGILPGPQEPSRSINSYLNPLVEEFTTFLQGVTVSIHTHQGTIKKLVRCALLCICCDLPAGRKVCGFLGHAARYGCSKCGKSFEGSVGQIDYSGFDRDTWPPRNVLEHRQVCQRLLSCCTKKDQHNIESNTGYRYSVLLKLLYFDSTRMLVVDPMHNLFLGTAKHVLKAIWIEKNHWL